MSELAAWVLGRDRPGIVAAVTGVLYDAGCNLEDCSMTLLSGHFAMMLRVRAPGEVTASSLEAALREAGEPLGLTSAVREVAEEGVAGEAVAAPHIVAVYGADRPGIVHRVSSLLAERGVNITDLDTRVLGDAEQPVYAMHLEVTLPGGADPDELAGDLAALGSELGVETSVHPVDADVL